jgi:hypothetical protein
MLHDKEGVSLEITIASRSLRDGQYMYMNIAVCMRSRIQPDPAIKTGITRCDCGQLDWPVERSWYRQPLAVENARNVFPGPYRLAETEWHASLGAGSHIGDLNQIKIHLALATTRGLVELVAGYHEGPDGLAVQETDGLLYRLDAARVEWDSQVVHVWLHCNVVAVVNVVIDDKYT